MLRSLLEWLSRGVVLKRRLPADLGGLALYVSPDASLKYWRRDLRNTDPLLLNAARRLVRPGDIVWDVGANTGLFSFAAAGLVGKGGQVIAVEPDPWLSKLLRKSTELNANSDCAVHVLPLAVGDRAGQAVLNIARRGRATNFIAGYRPSTQAGGVREEVGVELATLDGMLDNWAAPAVLKIDVEGAEAAVLRGAEKMLRDIRPRIMCEVSDENLQQVTEMLRSAGYVLYDANQDWPACGEIARCAWNTIALPLPGGVT